MKKALLLSLTICLTTTQLSFASGPQDWDAQGRYLYKHGDFIKSIEAFNNALKVDSKYNESYYNRAMVYVKTNNFKAAEADFDRFFKLTPAYKTFFTSDIINTLVENKNPELAVKYANMNIQEEPSPQSYVLRAKLNTEIGRPKEALNDANKALTLDPNYNPAYYEAGNANLSMGNYLQAVNNLNKFLETNPNSAEALVARASAFYKQGDKKNALYDYQRAIQINAEYKNNLPSDLK